MSSYLEIKEFIENKLTKKYKKQEGLNEHDILDEIDNIKKLLLTDARVHVFGNIEINLVEDDYIRMERGFEEHFNAKSQFGSTIKGLLQQERKDKTWWSNKVKLEEKSNIYYWNRYKKFLENDLPPEIINVMDEDTDVILDNLGNPKDNYFEIFGMVVGHVQSGKTANYSSLVCKAADAGYKFIVVIAGDKINLRNQTQDRLNEAFVGKDIARRVGVGLIDFRLDKLPESLTTSSKDFDTKASELNSQARHLESDIPFLLVIKKNTSTLTSIISWLKSHYPNKIEKHSMLIIDDESDYASINTKEEDDPTTINRKIRALLELFHNKSYVAYTATPYANIFIDHKVESAQDVLIDNKNKKSDISKDLFPRDFIHTLEAPNNYFGARKIFLEEANKYLVEIDDYQDKKDEKKGHIPSKHKKSFVDDFSSLPPSLYEAMRVFLINIAIRNLRGYSNKHNSMLVHISRFTDMHQKISVFIKEYIGEDAKDVSKVNMKTELNAYGLLDDAIYQSSKIRELKETFDSVFINSEFKWFEIQTELTNLIDTVIIREVHQKSKIKLEYRDDIVSNVIAIGGISLSRGYTLEGLSVSYFIRTTAFYDTLMQMGRWFGYRIGYQDLCKIYMPLTIIKKFTHIIEATEDLMDDFKRMAKEEMTPNDFGLAVKHHPDSGLHVTARNKQKNTKDIYFEMNLDGQAKETSWLSKNKEKRKVNIQAIENIINKLSCNEKYFEKIGAKYLWRDISKDIIYDFLNEFGVFSSDPFGLGSKMPIDFIFKYVDEIDTLWDVALYSGESNEVYKFSEKIIIHKEQRQLEMSKNDNQAYFEILRRQVSSGSAESIVLTKEERQKYGSKRKDIREAMKKPLLLLHVLDTPKDSTLAAFGISFPGGIKSEKKTIRLKINSVYIQDILEREESDD